MNSPLFRPAVANVISQLCKLVSGTSMKNFAIEWLLAIPLYNFLERKSEPYGKVKLDGELDWRLYNSRFGMDRVAVKIRKENK